jgi:hypothetical protein
MVCYVCKNIGLGAAIDPSIGQKFCPRVCTTSMMLIIMKHRNAQQERKIENNRQRWGWATKFVLFLCPIEPSCSDGASIFFIYYMPSDLSTTILYLHNITRSHYMHANLLLPVSCFDNARTSDLMAEASRCTWLSTLYRA